MDTDGGPCLSLHPGQMRAWQSNTRFTFVLSGTQGGKTSFAPWWLAREIEQMGSGDYVAVTANYDLLKLKMLPELLRCFCEHLKIGKFWAANKVIEIQDPKGKFWATTQNDDMYARIILRSASAGTGDVGVRGLESTTAKAAWLDECGMDDFSRTAWEAVLRRLSLNKGRVLGTTTLYNHDWLYDDVYQKFMAGDKDYDVVQFESIENPMFPLSEWERAKKALPEWKFNMMYRGVFDRPAGQIYGDFNTNKHVVDIQEIPAHYPIIVGIDPGAVHTATVWLAQSTDGKYTVFHESLAGDMTTAQHVANAKRISDKFSSVRFYGGAPSEKQFRMDWTNAGINVQAPGVTDVEAGIDRVISLIKNDKLRVGKNCPLLLRDLADYSRELDSRGEPTDKIRNKEKYHLADALRYAVSSVRTENSGGFRIIGTSRKW